MRDFLFLLTILLIVHTGFAQQKMRAVDELIDQAEPGWPMVKAWIDSAKNKVEVLPADSNKAKEALYQTQVTTGSPMGAIVYQTGGILVDNGWIRILGSGSPRLNRSLPVWNKGKSWKDDNQTPAYWLIADDVLGGFFAINNGAFSRDHLFKVFYLGPDNLEWENLDLTYEGFLRFCFSGNLEEFYKGYRWNNWQKDAAALAGDKVFAFFPFLWSKDWKDINKVTREPIAAGEQFNFNIETRKRLGLETGYHK